MKRVHTWKASCWNLIASLEKSHLKRLSASKISPAPQPQKAPPSQAKLSSPTTQGISLLSSELPQQAITNPTIPPSASMASQPPAWLAMLPAMPMQPVSREKRGPPYFKKETQRREKNSLPGPPTKGVYSMTAFLWPCVENSLQWSPMLLLLVGDAAQTVVCGCLFCACLLQPWLVDSNFSNGVLWCFLNW